MRACVCAALLLSPEDLGRDARRCLTANRQLKKIKRGCPDRMCHQSHLIVVLKHNQEGRSDVCIALWSAQTKYGQQST